MRASAPSSTRASSTAVRRVPPARLSFTERHSRAVRWMVTCTAAVLLFLAGMGTSSMMFMEKLDGVRGALKGGLAGGMNPGGPAGSGSGAAPQAPQVPNAELESWAKEQGLPAGLPQQALEMLYQQYPDGVPEDMKSKIEEQFGGQ